MTSYQPSFFDESERYMKLGKLNDPLIELSAYIDLETFKEGLEVVFEKPRDQSLLHSRAMLIRHSMRLGRAWSSSWRARLYPVGRKSLQAAIPNTRSDCNRQPLESRRKNKLDS